jgi:hypothetical protein
MHSRTPASEVGVGNYLISPVMVDAQGIEPWTSPV